MPYRHVHRWWTKVALWLFERPALVLAIALLVLALVVASMYSGATLLGQRLDAAISSGDSTRQLVDSTRALADTTRQIQKQQIAHSESLMVAFSRIDSTSRAVRAETHAVRRALIAHETRVLKVTRAEIDTLRLRERIARDQQVQAIKDATRKGN